MTIPEAHPEQDIAAIPPAAGAAVLVGLAVDIGKLSSARDRDYDKIA